MKSLESRRKKILDSFDEIDEMKKVADGSYRDEDELFDLLKTGDDKVDKELKEMLENTNIDKREDEQTKRTSNQRKDFLDSIKVSEEKLSRENDKKEEKSAEKAKADILKKLGLDR